MQTVMSWGHRPRSVCRSPLLSFTRSSSLRWALRGDFYKFLSEPFVSTPLNVSRFSHATMPRKKRRAGGPPQPGGQSQNITNGVMNGGNSTTQSDNQTPAGPWRPYQTRWNSGSRQQSDTAAPRNPNKKRNFGSIPQGLGSAAQSSVSNMGGSQQAQGAASMPQSLVPPYGPNMPSNQGASMGFPDMNAFPVFPPLPNIMDPSLMDFQGQFQPQGMPGQQPIQNQLPAGQQAPGMPQWNDYSNPANFLPFPPPPSFLNLTPTPAMRSTLSSFPMDPTAFAAAGSAAASTPSVSGRKSANAQRRRASHSPVSPPSATEAYLAQSALPPQKCKSRAPRPLLVILDLNGTLICRKHRRLPPNFASRAGLEKFLETLMAKYKVMIWSSSRPETVSAICQQLFPGKKRKNLVAEWGRDKFGLTAKQYSSKLQVYKTLQTVWANKSIQAAYPGRGKRNWDQTNTVLIDDSKLKALSEPYNILEIPELTNPPGTGDAEIFPKVLDRLEALSKCDDVSKALRLWNSKLSEDVKTILDLGIYPSSDDPLQPPPPISDEDQLRAQLRVERRKAQKQEKMARKKARRAGRNPDAVPSVSTGSAPPPPPPPPATVAEPSSSSSCNDGGVSIPCASSSSSPLPPGENTNTDTNTNQKNIDTKKENTAVPPPPPTPGSVSQTTTTSPPPTTTTTTNTTSSPPNDAHTRSPSPAASSTKSDNYLLDRLEESLNV